MGQIVGAKAKPKRANLNALSQVGTPALGEYVLVSSDNSMNAAGQGNFDCYIEGDGHTAAAALPLIKTYANDLDEEPTAGSENLVKSGGVYSKISQLSQDGVQMTDEHEFAVADKDMNVGMLYNEEGLDVAKISNHMLNLLEAMMYDGAIADTLEPGFFVIDKSLNVGAILDGNGLRSRNLFKSTIIES